MADEKETADGGKNCPSCKKPMPKIKRYYRNGVYYCNKNCFKNRPVKEVAAVPAPSASA